MIARSFFLLACLSALIGCASAPVDPPTAPATLTRFETEFDDRCFAKTEPQEVTRIVTEQVLVLPERTSPDGSITSPPVFREQSRPVVETVDNSIDFETLCPAERSEETIATLQRALKARVAYDGPITGSYDTPTQQAVQAFQRPSGYDSPEIARVVAEQLGVVPARRPSE
ncbi:MAG: peptidoglycan-binding domain-containing protein [Pseudomonadota bacterium]